MMPLLQPEVGFYKTSTRLSRSGADGIAKTRRILPHSLVIHRKPLEPELFPLGDENLIIHPHEI